MGNQLSVKEIECSETLLDLKALYGQDHYKVELSESTISYIHFIISSFVTNQINDLTKIIYNYLSFNNYMIKIPLRSLCSTAFIYFHLPHPITASFSCKISIPESDHIDLNFGLYDIFQLYHVTECKHECYFHYNSSRLCHLKQTEIQTTDVTHQQIKPTTTKTINISFYPVSVTENGLEASIQFQNDESHCQLFRIDVINPLETILAKTILAKNTMHWFISIRTSATSAMNGVDKNNLVYIDLQN